MWSINPPTAATSFGGLIRDFSTSALALISTPWIFRLQDQYPTIEQKELRELGIEFDPEKGMISKRNYLILIGK
jgi:hypothetical protein